MKALFRPLVLSCLVAGVFACVLTSGTVGPGRDWKAHPAVVQIDARQDVYAVGDPHGDYDRLVTLLGAAGLIGKDPPAPARARWAGGKSVVVFMGDLIDKWDQGVSVLTLLRALEADAARAGGRVVVLAGNHEVEFLATAGKSRKSADFVKELAARGAAPADVAAGTDKLGLGKYLRSLPFAARVNDCFFAHAGNTHGRTLKQLEKDLREGVEAKGYAAPVLRAKDSLVEARLHPAPWWERPGEPAEKSRARLAGWLKALGVAHLVIGHQPGKVRFADGKTRKAGEMLAYGDGLLFLTDTGMSRGVGYSTGAVLHLGRPVGGKTTRAEAVFPTGPARQLWAGR